MRWIGDGIEAEQEEVKAVVVEESVGGKYAMTLILKNGEEVEVTGSLYVTSPNMPRGISGSRAGEFLINDLLDSYR